jgi:hypothetical protein
MTQLVFALFSRHYQEICNCLVFLCVLGGHRLHHFAIVSCVAVGATDYVLDGRGRQSGMIVAGC